MDKLETVVNDHDKTLTLIAGTMERMNDNFHEFTENMKDMQKENNSNQKIMQQIMMKTENALEKLADVGPRISKIEDRQNVTGCPSLQGFQQKREEQLKYYESILSSMNKTIEVIAAAQNKQTEVNDYLKETTKVQIEQLKDLTRRISENESETEKNKDIFDKWRIGLYTGLISWGAGTIGTFGYIIHQLISGGKQ